MSGVERRGDGVVTGDGVVALSEQECFEHLARATAGYLSTTDRALPVIVPVALATVDGQLLLAAAFSGSLFGATARPRDTIVALAVGELGDGAYADGKAWSVVVQGVLRSPPYPSGACVLQPELVTGWRRAVMPQPTLR